MTPAELRQLCEIMKEFDIVSMSLGDVTIARQGAKPAAPPPQELKVEESVDIKHKVEEVKGVMQLGDDELLNRMFPEDHEEAVN